MSVEELVRHIRLHKEYIGGTNSAYRGVPELCDQIADKLEELAADQNEAIQVLTLKWQNAEAALAEAKRENEALREALTPSGATKPEYIGEFSFYVDFDLGGACEVSRNVSVPWTTIKEIMKAIADRAARNAGGNDA